jgi:hypothetical protein
MSIAIGVGIGVSFGKSGDLVFEALYSTEADLSHILLESRDSETLEAAV